MGDVTAYLETALTGPWLAVHLLLNEQLLTGTLTAVAVPAYAHH